MITAKSPPEPKLVADTLRDEGMKQKREMRDKKICKAINKFRFFDFVMPFYCTST